MGVQASTASPHLAASMPPLPANVGFQAGHMGLLNLAGREANCLRRVLSPFAIL